MFYNVKGLKTQLRLEPNNLDLLKDQKFIKEQVIQKLEGRYDEKYGYIIYITQTMNIDDLNDALIEEDGSISFRVTFEAITFQMKQNDIVDCEVIECKPECLICKLGPIQIIVPKQKMPQNLTYINETYRDDDEEAIRQGTKLRVMIEKTHFKVGRFKGFASMTGDRINNICGIINDDLKL
ncbi:hypothetical protein pb186bvf_007035 [Paramecium bursaria]